MKLPPRRLAGALILLAVLVAACLFLLLFPPISFLKIGLGHYIAPPTSWDSAGRSGRLCFVEGLKRPVQGAEFRIQRLGLKHDLFKGIAAQEWNFEVLDAAVVPANSRWPSLKFVTGKGRWLSRQNRLELRDWVSSTFEMNADLEWDAQGDLLSARVWGEADILDLSRALSAWKKYDPAKTADEPARKKYELIFSEGSIFIRVNDKPFFKASWRSNSSF